MHKIDSVRRNDDSNEAVVICDGEYFRITVHDLETMDIEDGDLVGKGTHEELLESCDVYNEIYMSQYKKGE